jgi:hypothetical protein
MFPKINSDYLPKSITWPIFVMQTQHVFYDVETDFYNIVYMKPRLETFAKEKKRGQFKKSKNPFQVSGILNVSFNTTIL